jgi:hypothetical protein
LTPYRAGAWGEQDDAGHAAGEPGDLERRHRLAEHDDPEQRRDRDVQIRERHYRRDRQVVEREAVEERADTGEQADAETSESRAGRGKREAVGCDERDRGGGCRLGSGH